MQGSGCGRLRNGLGWCCPSDMLPLTAARAVGMRSPEIWGEQNVPGRICAEPQV